MISVCIPTYNGEEYLKEQLDSILIQLSEGDEVIVSDDSSSDHTLSILESYHDPRIRILRDNFYRSPIFNLENALRYAKGDYIFMADQDDVWQKDKVEKSLTALQIYDLVVSDAYITDRDGRVTMDSFFKQHGSKGGYWRNLQRNNFVGCCMAFRKECLEYLLPFPKGIAMHDMWIGLCIELHGSTLFLPEQLIYYRRHEHNSSQTGNKSKFSLSHQLYYRIYLLFTTIARKLK